MDKAPEELGEEFKKFNTELPNGKASLLLGIDPKELRTGAEMNALIRVFAGRPSHHKVQTPQSPPTMDTQTVYVRATHS